MDADSTRISEAITEVARLLHTPMDADETLAAIAHAARHTVPGFDHVGVSITHRDGTIETRAGTDQLVWDLDALQYGLKEGPCYESIVEQGVLLVENAHHAQRWPRYIPQAAERGLRAQLAVGLYEDGDSLGGLNLYSTGSATIDDDAVPLAELFATHAALALGRFRAERELNDAIASRQVIGQATGILMERYQLDAHRAFGFLVRTSQTGNVKLRDVAAELVSSTDTRYTMD
ncbi:GAF and ANTAR domain-containing protein [Nocardioides sp. GXQ0305]|uniref:GAF and ANTAR domain-containing protein n=1 Tax=Nocardioides sp. GXQ0305 TaxID=3423912 RepID=UPI003D7EA2BA